MNNLSTWHSNNNASRETDEQGFKMGAGSSSATTTENASKNLHNKDKLMQRIQISLNKMTKNNFETQQKEITGVLDSIASIDVATSDSDAIPTDAIPPLHSTVTEIFHICIRNGMMGDIYAELFISCIRKETYAEIFNQVFQEQMEIYRQSFDDIHYVDPDKDNDGFCLYTKKNTTRRFITKFLVTMLLNEAMPMQEFISLLRFMFEKVFRCVEMKTENRRNELEEVTENLFIAVSGCAAKMKEEATEDWNEIMNRVGILANLVVKEKPNMTSRAKFKYQDLLKMK
jgi:hypothetical protein